MVSIESPPEFKVDSFQGKVIATKPNKNYFECQLDTLPGNSGSPIFNSKNEVIGILVRGTHRVYLEKHGGDQCLKIDNSIFKVEGEECQRIKSIKNALTQINKQ